MSEPAGIVAQSTESVLEDVEEFIFGYLPWYHGSVYTPDRTNLVVTMTDPNEDEGDNESTKNYELSGAKFKDAYAAAKMKGYHLCCAGEIDQEQLGLGCAHDLDVILQTACYGEVTFA